MDRVFLPVVISQQTDFVLNLAWPRDFHREVNLGSDRNLLDNMLGYDFQPMLGNGRDFNFKWPT